MEQQNDLQSNACERAMELHTRALVGEAVDASERHELELHVVGCAECRKIQEELQQADTQLRTALSSNQVSSTFAQRTLAALPAAPETIASTPEMPRVFAATPARRSWASRLSIAAALVAGVLVVWAASSLISKRPGNETRAPMSVVRGKLLDANGNAVTQLKQGAVYTVQADSVVPLSDANIVNLKEGAEFQVQGDNALKLTAGDLFAYGRPESDQKPLRVSCSTFDTLLHAGDFYVAEDGAQDSSSVVIVFNGQAQITRDNETLPLRAGQVFYVLAAEDMVFAQTIELSDAVARLHNDPGVQRKDLADLRDLYEKQIRGYQKELVELDKQLKSEQNAQKLAELRKRQQLVLNYRDEHQRKLKSFWREFPYEELKRGLNNRTEPSTWL
jgi:hypothetical protein